MKQLSLPYHITKPPRVVSRAKLDNIALVPASLLSLKGTYQPIANKLPQGSVLICEAPTKPRLRAILACVASFFRSHGHQVTTLSLSSLTVS